MEANSHSHPSFPQRVANRVGQVSHRRIIVVASVLIAVMILLTSVHVRVALKSAGFFTEIFPDMPAYPLRWFTDEPRRELVTFTHEGEEILAYFYRPMPEQCSAGMVFYIGVGPEHQDPHLDRVSRAFARNGIAVLIPVSDPLVDERLTPEEPLVSVSAFRSLQDMETIHPERVGMFGVSVGGSIVAKGAQDPRINDEVRLVHSLGGYYDAFELLASMTLGKFRAEGEWVDWEPSNVTIRVVRNSILPALPREDYEALWHLFTDDDGEIPDGLTFEGEALARVLVNRDPERVPELMADLPEELTELMQAISPSHGIESLVANTLLLHDKHDYVLPYGESVRFYHDLRSVERKHLTLLEVFHHVRPDEEGGYLELVRDATRLYRHVYLMHRPLDDRGWFTWPPGLTGDATCPEQVDRE